MDEFECDSFIGDFFVKLDEEKKQLLEQRCLWALKMPHLMIQWENKPLYDCDTVKGNLIIKEVVNTMMQQKWYIVDMTITTIENNKDKHLKLNILETGLWNITESQIPIPTEEKH